MNSSLRISFAFLCALRIAMSEKSAFLAKLFLRARGTAIRQHHAWSRGFCFAQRTRRARSNNGKGDPPRTLSPRPAPLRAPVPSGTVLVAACRARPWNLTFGTRCFEQEKTERTEHRWTWSSLRCLRFLMFKKCVWLRLAALRLRVFALNPVCIDTLSAPTSAFSLLTLGGWHPNHWP